jgi:hypothetical protein
MAAVRRLVIDVLKPHDPSSVEIARTVADLGGVDGVNVTLVETDREVQTLKLTIEGSDVNHETIETTVEELGGSVHSIDQVVCGESVVEGVPTPQD